MSTHLTHNFPKFSSLELTKFESQLDELLANNRHQLKILLAQKTPYTWYNLMQAIEERDYALQVLWAPISHLHSVADSETLRHVYKNALLKLADYQLEILQNVPLFEAVQTISQSEAFKELTLAQQKVIENMLRDFRRSGVHLSAEDKIRFADLNQQLVQLTTQFQENLLDATQAWTYHTIDPADLAGLPDAIILKIKQAADEKNKTGWLFTLDMPTYFAVMNYADSQSLRETFYLAHNTRASDQGPFAGQWDNKPVIDALLTTKLEIVQLLGFKNYADYSLAIKMAKVPQTVLDFLHSLIQASVDKAHQEMAELQQFALAQFKVTQLQVWDIAYYSEKLRQHTYDVSTEVLRPYFPVPQVILGLFEIIHRLYGMRFDEVLNPDVWDKTVTVYTIYDCQHQVRGYLYLDLYARHGKRDGAWMNDAYPRCRLANGDIQLPIAFIACNFNAPLGNEPALLTHDEVTTLFHECGHALQHILTLVDHAGISGINGVPWDAVEIASQFMENWCWEKESIDLIAKHYQTHAPLPDDLFDKLIGAKNFQSAMQMMRQLQFALFDLRCYLEFNPIENNQIQRILDEVREQLSVFPVPEWNRFQNGFSHIFGGGYDAGYYSYKWAEVLACDAFSLFKEKGIFNRQLGEAFLHTFLESGGSKDPMELFIQFQGRPPAIDALLAYYDIH